MLKRMTINAILWHIESNIENTPLDINDLVKYSGYSRRYLQLIFKRYTGVPIGSYIQLRRITRAATLLRATQLSILAISEQLFYDSQQTFTREFKKTQATPPCSTEKLTTGHSVNPTRVKKIIYCFTYLKFVVLILRCFMVQKYGIQKKAPFLTQHQIISGI